MRTADSCVASLKQITELTALPLSAINLHLVEKWRLKRLDNGIKPSTINRQLGSLSASLNRAVEWGFLDKNPLNLLKRCKEDPNPKTRFLTEDERQRLYDSLDKREERIREERRTLNLSLAKRGLPLYPDLSSTAFADHLKPAVLISLNTGLRRGELFGLKWDDIDIANRRLTVKAEAAKTGKTRHIDLNDNALTVLDGWLSQSQSKKGFVFTYKGNPLHDVRKSWAGVLAGSGIKNFKPIKSFRWHDMRHTFASDLVMKGVDLNTVRELLGHSDYKMTLRYAHLAPEYRLAAVQTINKKISLNGK